MKLTCAFIVALVCLSFATQVPAADEMTPEQKIKLLEAEKKMLNGTIERQKKEIAELKQEIAELKKNKTEKKTATTSESKPNVSYASYQSIKNGMTYEQVRKILGSAGEELSRTSLANIETVIFTWTGKTLGSNMNVTFQNGRVISKAQFGLK